MKKKHLYMAAGIGLGLWWLKSSVAEAATKTVEAGTSKAIRWSSPLLYKDVWDYLSYKIGGGDSEDSEDIGGGGR
ncbi:hypothetical protein [Marinimicrobium agarilyticum]|uniref:hypothetical protein n=1 Tax=Marinimicrobium agarilyticum TaxID=306546 RepID=UPI0004278EFE|nr:hypothetical protein [Marinimicrobium agarilyticum]